MECKGTEKIVVDQSRVRVDGRFFQICRFERTRWFAISQLVGSAESVFAVISKSFDRWTLRERSDRISTRLSVERELLRIKYWNPNVDRLSGWSIVPTNVVSR